MKESLIRRKEGQRLFFVQFRKIWNPYQKNKYDEFVLSTTLKTLVLFYSLTNYRVLIETLIR